MITHKLHIQHYSITISERKRKFLHKSQTPQNQAYYGSVRIQCSRPQINVSLSQCRGRCHWCKSERVVDQKRYIWRTPDKTGSQDDCAPFTTTLWYRSDRNEWSQFCIVPHTPYWLSLLNKRQWGTLSNALEKSKIAMSVRKPLSIDFAQSLIQETRWVLQENRGRKPCCRGVSIHWYSTCLQTLE